MKNTKVVALVFLSTRLVLKPGYTNYIERHRKQPLQIKQHIEADIIPLLGDYLIESLETRDISQALDQIVKRGSPVHAKSYARIWCMGVSRLRTLHLVGESPTEVKDSSLVAWEASWRESKTMEPSDNKLRKEYAQCTRL